MDLLERRIEKIESRNAFVESDKAWETSWVRRGVLALFTYVTVGVFLMLIDVARPWINAIVPVIGFTISTLTIPVCKKIWLKHR